MFANVVPSYPFAPEGNLFWKVTNITFAYLLSPTILQHFKQIVKQGCIILAQIGPKLPILPKRYILGKLTILCAYCVLSYNNILKKNLGEQIITQGCLILAQIGLNPVHQKGIFGKSWPTLHWSFISHYAT